mgnify:CR=1 FL=1
MKKVKIFIIFSICVIIEVQLARLIPFIRRVPIQFLLIFLIYFCLDYEWFDGLLTGTVAGTILDILSGGNLGVFALSYGIIGMLIGIIQPLIFKEEFMPRMFLIFFASILLQFINYNIIRNYQSNSEFIRILLLSILPGAFINCIFAAPVFILIKKDKIKHSSWNRDRERV